MTLLFVGQFFVCVFTYTAVCQSVNMFVFSVTPSFVGRWSLWSRRASEWNSLILSVFFSYTGVCWSMITLEQESPWMKYSDFVCVFQLHRRLLVDDHFGAGEPLNEILWFCLCFSVTPSFVGRWSLWSRRASEWNWSWWSGTYCSWYVIYINFIFAWWAMILQISCPALAAFTIKHFISLNFLLIHGIVVLILFMWLYFHDYQFVLL